MAQAIKSRLWPPRAESASPIPTASASRTNPRCKSASTRRSGSPMKSWRASPPSTCEPPTSTPSSSTPQAFSAASINNTPARSSAWIPRRSAFSSTKESFPSFLRWASMARDAPTGRTPTASRWKSPWSSEPPKSSISRQAGSSRNQHRCRASFRFPRRKISSKNARPTSRPDFSRSSRTGPRPAVRALPAHTC